MTPPAAHGFERLYERHWHELRAWLTTRTGSREEAEDIAQAAFLNAYRAYVRGDRPDKPRAWLYRIAENVRRRRFRGRIDGLIITVLCDMDWLCLRVDRILIDVGRLRFYIYRAVLDVRLGNDNIHLSLPALLGLQLRFVEGRGLKRVGGDGLAGNRRQGPTGHEFAKGHRADLDHKGNQPDCRHDERRLG